MAFRAACGKLWGGVKGGYKGFHEAHPGAIPMGAVACGGGSLLVDGWHNLECRKSEEIRGHDVMARASKWAMLGAGWTVVLPVAGAYEILKPILKPLTNLRVSWAPPPTAPQTMR